MITRFAPSPTGHLHLGHAFSALYAYQLAQEHQGEFVLRFEDIDITRVREYFYEQILDDLKWLGIEWQQPVMKQIQRNSAYLAALEQLKKQGLIYPCFCSRKQIETELAHMVNAPHGPEGAHYPGTCKKLTQREIQNHLDAGDVPAWRFDAECAAKYYSQLTFTDHYSGVNEVDPFILGDTILARKDIGTSYHIAVVVDDAFQNISHVARGEDLLPATHIHRILQEALNFPEPYYYHHPLICNDQGKRLAKRDDAMSLKTLRESGVTKKDILKQIQEQVADFHLFEKIFQH